MDAEKTKTDRKQLPPNNKIPAQKDQKLHAGHRERKRSQYIACGEGSFADHELLELLLFYSIPRKDTNAVAHKLLNQFGSLRAVLTASMKDIAKVGGIGENTAILLSLIAPLYRRAMMSGESKGNGRLLNTTERIGAYLVNLFLGESKEIMYQICLDTRGRRINTFRVSEGGPSGVDLNIREIVSNAMFCNAVMVVLAHNHPSGIAYPSPGDQVGTEQVREALEAVGVRLADHIIVAGDEYFSMSREQMI